MPKATKHLAITRQARRGTSPLAGRPVRSLVRRNNDWNRPYSCPAGKRMPKLHSKGAIMMDIDKKRCAAVVVRARVVPLQVQVRSGCSSVCLAI